MPSPRRLAPPWTIEELDPIPPMTAEQARLGAREVRLQMDVQMRESRALMITPAGRHGLRETFAVSL